MNCNDYIETKWEPLVEFFASCTSTDINRNHKRKIYSFCLLLKQVERLRKQNYVGHLAFAQSLVKWNFSGSKATYGLDSCSYSSGSITTLKNFMKEISINENKCVIAKDIDVFVDKKGKNQE